jgi:hypothetical protein
MTAKPKFIVWGLVLAGYVVTAQQLSSSDLLALAKVRPNASRGVPVPGFTPLYLNPRPFVRGAGGASLCFLEVVDAVRAHLRGGSSGGHVVLVKQFWLCAFLADTSAALRSCAGAWPLAASAGVRTSS